MSKPIKPAKPAPRIKDHTENSYQLKKFQTDNRTDSTPIGQSSFDDFTEENLLKTPDEQAGVDINETSADLKRLVFSNTDFNQTTNLYFKKKQNMLEHQEKLNEK